MVSEAEKQGVNLRVLEAGGYPNKKSSRAATCAVYPMGADAIILGTVDPHAYEHNLKVGSATRPYLQQSTNSILMMNSALLKGEVGVDWYWMGYEAGKYLAERHPKGSGKTNIALLLGPRTRGGTKPVTTGFYEAIKTATSTSLTPLGRQRQRVTA